MIMITDIKVGDKVIFKCFVCTIIGIVYNRGAFAGYIIESPKLYGDITVPESDLEHSCWGTNIRLRESFIKQCLTVNINKEWK